MDDILLAQHNSSHSTQPHSIIAKSLVLCQYVRKKKFNSKIRQNPKVDVFEYKIVLQSNIIISNSTVSIIRVDEEPFCELSVS